MAIKIHQIFYDAATRAELDRGFIPYDNSKPEHPEWYEFWPIYKYFKTQPLDENTWYGFVSPKFGLKTGYKSDDIKMLLQAYDTQADVALFSSTWDFIAYYRNSYEQGEVWHEGMTVVGQAFFNAIGYPVVLSDLVNHSQNAVTSNYIIAKPIYWRRWLQFAEKLIEVSETQTDFGALLRGDTTYGPKRVPFKVFLQERLHSVILAKENFRVFAPDQSSDRRLFEALFNNDLRTRRTLQACDLLKERFTTTDDPGYLDTYLKLKASIPIKPTKFR